MPSFHILAECNFLSCAKPSEMTDAVNLNRQDLGSRGNIATLLKSADDSKDLDLAEGSNRDAINRHNHARPLGRSRLH